MKDKISEKVMENPVEEMTPSQYFEYVKSKKNTITNEELKRIYKNAEAMARRAQVTGQTKVITKLKFFMETLEKEMEIVDKGYTQYVYRWDLTEYIEKISDKSVVIIELENFERDLPDNVVDEVVKAKEVFGKNLYIVFTDYTGGEKRKIAKERREKDPILFGAVTKDDKILDRLYYITDWVDEQCDLTLAEIVEKYDEYHKGDAGYKPLVHDIEIPKDELEFKIAVDRTEIPK